MQQWSYGILTLSIVLKPLLVIPVRSDFLFFILAVYELYNIFVVFG